MPDRKDHVIMELMRQMDEMRAALTNRIAALAEQAERLTAENAMLKRELSGKVSSDEKPEPPYNGNGSTEPTGEMKTCVASQE